MARVVVMAMAIMMIAGVSGCSLPSRGDVYSRKETRQSWDVRYGQVTDVDSATIEGQRTPLGRIGGGYVGYETGRAIGGHGTGGDIGGAVGAVAGAVAGEAIEESVTRQQGLQITVALDGGRTIAVVQAADQPFSVGEKVKVFSRRDGAARIAKL
jgi:outer membrane lipoprotein SlyB